MKRSIILCLLLFVVSFAFAGDYVPGDYVWTSPSANSSGSMPCGGGDIGMNVWVEHGDVLFYLSRSGMFDENNTLLKAGRFRIRLSPNPFLGAKDFKQILHLKDGSVEIKAGGTTISLWTDVYSPIVYVEIRNAKHETVSLSYESWRYKDRLITKSEAQQCSYKWLLPKNCYTRHDSVFPNRSSITFFHDNGQNTVFDYTVHRESLDTVKSLLYNPIGGLVFGGKLLTPDLQYTGTSKDVYASTDYQAWNYQSQHPIKNTIVAIAMHSGQEPVATWQHSVDSMKINAAKSRERSARWWHDYWQRSFIEADGEAAEIARNYTLFRYMLGCNAYGKWPTKFNGGLFTFDPVYVDSAYRFTPDYRNWGGGTMTAQNQRLVYWPMLKSGDYDMMQSEFGTYLRLLPSAVARTKAYWGHDGACFAEQIENFGLPNPAEYGSKRPVWFDNGVEYNAWLEYTWDTVLEFCQMILDAHNYGGVDITKYEPLISESVHFFDTHYRYLAQHRGIKDFDGNGKLILYPASGCETFKMAYNPSSTIAALKSVLQTWGKDSLMLNRIPDIPLRVLKGDTCIAPAVTWERIQNVETPQLYPVFPWRIYGVGHSGLNIARNTYLKDQVAVNNNSYVGWKQYNIWAACLGLTDEAARLTKQKLHSGPYRFPAFWEKGYDWAPDHNRGGSAMIGLQEMLLQESEDGHLLLFPAWPKTWNVHFRLHASNNRVVEAEMNGGQIKVIRR